MKKIAWNIEKAAALRKDITRGKVGFEDCVIAMDDGRILADIDNPSPRYPGQRMMVLRINDYAYVVPYIETDEEIFLKTVFPSRKHTALYLTE